MKVINNEFEIELLCCSFINNYYNLSFSIKMKKEMTDTDFCFNFSTKLNKRDLQYISDNFKDLLNNVTSSFGFKSSDKTMTLYFELENDGVINQFEIWKFFSINTYCTYNINLETDIFFIEQLCSLFDYIKKSGSVKETAFVSKDNASLEIEIFKNDESNDYSLCLKKSENRIVRKNCLQQKEVDYLRTQLAMLLAGDIMYINIESENLFLSICSFGSDYLLDGEISDFSFPHSNKIKLSGGYLLERDVIYKVIR